MADPRIISRILQLGKELGANISNSMGTRSNVSFLGSGPKDGMLFQKPINPESFATIGIEKVLPDIESSIGYASGNKLNGLQLDQLEKNLLTMKETLNPTNIVEMGTGGLDSLRAKSGLGERQATEAASDTSRVKKEAVEKYGISPERFDEVMNSQFDEKLGDDLLRETSGVNQADVEGLGSLRSGKRMLDEDEIAELDMDIGGLEYTNDFDGTLASANKLRKERADYIAEMEMEYKRGNLDPGPGEANRERFLQKKFDEMEASGDKRLMTRDEIEELSSLENTSPVTAGADNTGIMASVERGDLPAKTGAAREFLVNTLKVGDEASSTTLSDIISAKDFKAIMEGGGGAEGDPLVLVQKYFGPRIAEMIPNGGTTEEIAIFTKRVLNNVEDAKGFRPDDPEFDAMTATFVDYKANGGRAGYAKGGLAKILEL